ncbi:MAG: (2Fe-2S)-binding protein, partial [Flaviaesturariibacter sp.]|nr:(2Fe-2S)-binding protein [Flaviaesturariibacter sp.]
EEAGAITIGGSVTVTQLLESPVMKMHFPEFATHMKLVSSTPIRNMATLAGNLVNASPIGDLTAFFLALNATLTLKKDRALRQLPLRNFYRSYKQTDRADGELVQSLSFPVPPSGSVFSFEKVSKRTNLDIASVNSACQALVGQDNSIQWIHLSAGGVAPTPKYLGETTIYLTGRQLSEDVLEQALATADREIAPISDARGTTAYKRLLLRQLLLAHFLKLAGPTEPVVKLLLP